MMESEAKILRELKRLKLSFYLTILVIIAAIAVLVPLHIKNCCIERDNSKHALNTVTYDYGLIQDSVDVLKFKIYKNKQIEDSLQSRIIRTLDSLEILEGKLRVMHNISGMANEVLESVLDSIDFYRKQTEKLKKEIKRISRENETLLQRERLENASLKARIMQFDKRLKAVYAINSNVTTYFNGHNTDGKLIEASKARKVNEIKVGFKLTRSKEEGDVFSVELIKGHTRVMENENINIVKNDRTIINRFEISDVVLKPGKYKIVIYHENAIVGIERQSIGESYFELN